MIVYIDENMPPHLARGFDILQKPISIKMRKDIEVKSIKDVFGEGAKDEDWIPIAGKQGACVITQDYNIQRTKHQRELCHKYDLGMFYFRPPSKYGFQYWDMIKLVVKHWIEIAKESTKKERPFAFRITQKGGITEM